MKKIFYISLFCLPMFFMACEKKDKFQQKCEDAVMERLNDVPDCCHYNYIKFSEFKQVNLSLEEMIDIGCKGLYMRLQDWEQMLEKQNDPIMIDITSQMIEDVKKDITIRQNEIEIKYTNTNYTIKCSYEIYFNCPYEPKYKIKQDYVYYFNSNAEIIIP